MANRYFPQLLLIALVVLVILHANKSNTPCTMSDAKQPKTQEEKDKELFDPDNLIVNLGGKQVPFSKINKPHAVTVDPKSHKPVPNPETFPDIEPEAKEREEKLAAERAEKKNE